jgi:hypothetical protein
MAKLQVFELFSRLPHDIREEIWKAALRPAGAVKLETEYLGPWDELPWGGPPHYDRRGIEERHHEEFQYYVDLYGYKDLREYEELDVHENGYTYEEVYVLEDLTGFRVLCC